MVKKSVRRTGRIHTPAFKAQVLVFGIEDHAHGALHDLGRILD